MTKGESYRLYYEANKERILQVNKERAKEQRELCRVSPEDEKIYREKRKKRDEVRKASHYKIALEELSKRNTDKYFSLFYKRVSESPLLSEITPSIMSFFMRIHCEIMESDKVDGNNDKERVINTE